MSETAQEKAQREAEEAKKETPEETPELDYNEIHGAPDFTTLQTPEEDKTGEPVLEKVPETPEDKKPEDNKPGEPEAVGTPTPPVETKAPETPAAPIIDVENLAKTISQETAQKTVEALTGGEKDEDEVYPWEKENRNPSYKEALDYVTKKAEDNIMKRLDAEVKAETDAEQAKVQAHQEQVNRYNAYMKTQWDAQFADLEENGRIPKVTNWQDPKDEGRQAREKIFSLMTENHAKAVAAGKVPSTSLKETYYEHYITQDEEGNPVTKPVETKRDMSKQKNAPVAGATKSVSQGNSEDIDYWKDVHNADINDILKEQYMPKS